MFTSNCTSLYEAETQIRVLPRWTLVETIGFKPDGWLDINGSPLTEAAKMTERFRRLDYGNLEIAITVDAPKAYTKPWTVTVRQSIVLDNEMIEFICAENERDVRHMVGK